MFIGPCIIAIVDEWNTNLMSLAILFHLLYAQHVSDINISIFRSLRLYWWITTSVILFSVRCVLELLVRVIHQHNRKLLKMGILMSETCWAHNKWNKITSESSWYFIRQFSASLNIFLLWHSCSLRSVFNKLVLTLFFLSSFCRLFAPSSNSFTSAYILSRSSCAVPSRRR